MSYSLVQYPFAAGVDEKTQAELVDPGSAYLTLENLVHGKAGSVEKLNGFDALAKTISPSGNVASCRRLFAYGETVNLVDASANIYQRNPAVGSWTLTGRLPEPAVTRTPIVSSSIIPVFDVVTVGGYQVIAWKSPCAARASGIGLFVAVVDAITGAFVLPPTLTAAADPVIAFELKMTAAGSVAWIVYHQGSTIYGISVDTTTLVVANPVSLVTDLLNPVTASGQFDTLAGGAAFYLVYTTTVNTYRLVSFNAAGVATGALQSGSNVLRVGIGGGDTDTIWVAWMQTPANNTISVIGYNAALGVVAAAATVITTSGAYPTALGVVRTGPGAGMVAAGNDDPTYGGSNKLYWRPFDTLAGAVRAGAGPGYAQASAHHFVLDSRPFLGPTGVVYAMVRAQSGSPPSTTGLATDTQQNFFCLELVPEPGETPRVVANIAPRLSLPAGNAYSALVPHLPPRHLGAGPNGTSVLALSRVKMSGQTGIAEALELTTLEFSPTNRWQPANANGLLHLTGAVASVYDGARTQPIGFLVTPDIKSTGFAPAGANNFPAGGVWFYVAIYERTDSKGNVHRSAPSAPFKFAPVSNTESVTLTVSTLTATSRYAADGSAGTVAIAIYRTQNGGTVYQRVHAQAGTLGTGTALNDPTLHTVNIVDQSADNAVAANELLYTQPGTLGTTQPKVAPPGFAHLIQHTDRLVGAEGVTVWPSAAVVNGEAPWFADAFQVPILPGRGPITGLASMSGRLLVFKAGRTFLLDGAFPLDNGAENGLTPVEVANVGCIDARSIVVTQEGCFFRSATGIELLTPGLQLVPRIGKEVEDSLQHSPVITSAVYDEAAGRVYFTCVAGELATTGTTLIYDLLFHSWATRQMGITLTVGASACMVGTSSPVYHCADWAGSVYRRAAGYYDSVGGVPGYVPSYLETGWVKLGGPQGYQRIRRIVLLGQYLDAHDLFVDFAYDYIDEYVETRTWTNAQLLGLPLEQLDIRPTRTKCEAMKIRIHDGQPTGGGDANGQGFRLVGLAFEALVKKGRNQRIPLEARR